MMILKLENEEEIQGIKIGKLALAISNLFFADDILIFCKANVNHAEKIIKCLETLYSGQAKVLIQRSQGAFSQATYKEASRLLSKAV